MKFLCPNLDEKKSSDGFNPNSYNLDQKRSNNLDVDGNFVVVRL